MSLAIDPDRLHTETEQIIEIITAIKKTLDGTIPNEDVNVDDDTAELWVRRLHSEYVLAAQRLTALANIIAAGEY